MKFWNLPKNAFSGSIAWISTLNLASLFGLKSFPSKLYRVLSVNQLESIVGGVDFDQLRRDNLDKDAVDFDQLRRDNLDKDAVADPVQ